MISTGDLDMTTNKARFSATVACFAFGLLTSVGCGNALKPGDYRIYKMDLQTQTQSNGCYPLNTPDPNTKFDTDTTLSSGTWVLTTDTSDNVFMDVGKVTLQGVVTDAGYTFKGDVVNVEFEDDDITKTRITVTTTTVVDVTIDGKSIGGTATSTGSYRCSSPTATMPCPNPLPSDCSKTSKFSGTEVDDVELQYPVK
jgi:hypothetical protein